jgi:phosphoribosylformylglycinamidine cyclo-ligase
VTSAGEYAAAGVDLAGADEAKARIAVAVAGTRTALSVGKVGAFGGMVRVPAGMRKPALVLSTDGVGTKVMVALQAGRFDTVGEDLVNHSVNDILVHGATPIAFMDYIAGSGLTVEQIAGLVEGIARGCRAHAMALAGGETAQMPGLYQPGTYDLAGTIIGVVEEDEALHGDAVVPGDVLLGYASTGLHTNGYTLARMILEDAGISYEETPEGFERAIGEEYLVPHRAYVRGVLALREAVEVRGMAHITGGGLPGNLPRALGGLGARLYPSTWEETRVFGFIRALGGIAEEEMRGVFNLGVGFCVVVPSGESERALEVLRGAGCDARRVGEVVAEPGVEFVT